MLIIGAGLGSFMQVTILAVQNAVNPGQLGTATSSVTFFRTIGSSLGGAVFGTILLSRLNHHLAQALPSTAAQHISSSSITTNGTAAIHHLSPQIQNDILQAFVRSYHDMFLVGIPFALAAFVVALFLREQPLRSNADLPSEKAEDIQSHAPVSG
jgi:MFS family permease